MQQWYSDSDTLLEQIRANKYFKRFFFNTTDILQIIY